MARYYSASPTYVDLPPIPGKAPSTAIPRRTYPAFRRCLLPPPSWDRLFQVLDAQGSTYASDVYSFGVVAWEVLSRELPWARVTHPKVVYIRVVLKALRPEIPADAPADLANAVAACWAGDPEVRPKFSDLMETMAAKGWTEQHA